MGCAIINSIKKNIYIIYENVPQKVVMNSSLKTKKKIYIKNVTIEQYNGQRVSV